MITKVYLAGASKEIDRARHWAQQLREADIVVTSTWVEVIGKAGAANPADATPEQYAKWTLRDLAEVDEANFLWLQLPAPGVVTVGAYVELGRATVGSKIIVMSGGPHRPIFTPALADLYFEKDEDAFAFIQKEHRALVQLNIHNHNRRQELVSSGLNSQKLTNTGRSGV